MAVATSDVYAIYVINANSNDTSFSFNNVTGLFSKNSTALDPLQVVFTKSILECFIYFKIIKIILIIDATNIL
jgi:hypothetical protein